MASAARTEAKAPVTDVRFKDRFNDEPYRLLDDAILDRRHGHIELH